MKTAPQGHKRDYLKRLGVADLPALTSPLDSGYDPATIEGHIEQSHHLMSMLELSMACWIIADEDATRKKIRSAHKAGVPTVTGGGPFEIAVAQGVLDEYLDRCVSLGVDRIECGERFAGLSLPAAKFVKRAHARRLEVQFELGKRSAGPFSSDNIRELIGQGRRWLDAGALQVVAGAREISYPGGFGGGEPGVNLDSATRLVTAFGVETLVFETASESIRLELLDAFGAEVQFCGVRLEDLLHLELCRRGLHSEALSNESLRTKPMVKQRAAAAG